MTDSDESWKPGSFTKDFSWERERGLQQVRDCIRAGFDGRLEDVPRGLFESRTESAFNFYIPADFFLFNKDDMIVVDELVFQALTGPPGPRFDKLALFAFNFSYAGVFRGSSPEPSGPALWAQGYVRDRVAKTLNWDTKTVDADDIERFVEGDLRYQARGARTLATNLNHLFDIGRLGEMGSENVERWWADALFLALDRLVADRLIDRLETREDQYAGLLEDSGFQDIAGKRSLEKVLATKHLLRLYVECGGRDRFSESAVKARIELRLADVERWVSPNDESPLGAVHPSNPRILKSIPATCAMLAIWAGFEVISSLAMENFDSDAFVREHTRNALQRLKALGVRPNMTAEEVLRLTRGR